jgi:hypothetical protein
VERDWRSGFGRLHIQWTRSCWLVDTIFQVPSNHIYPLVLIESLFHLDFTSFTPTFFLVLNDIRTSLCLSHANRPNSSSIGCPALVLVKEAFHCFYRRKRDILDRLADTVDKSNSHPWSSQADCTRPLSNREASFISIIRNIESWDIAHVVQTCTCSKEVSMINNITSKYRRISTMRNLPVGNTPMTMRHSAQHSERTMIQAL